MMSAVVDQGLDLIDDWYGRAERWMLADQRALRGASFARILSGISVFGILFTNFRARDLLFGPASSWNLPLQDASGYAPPRLVENMGSTAFLFFYLAVMALAVAWILGWHTRVVGSLMLVGNIAIIERIPVLGDQGDNILRVGLLIVIIMNSSEYWSLDARRRARTEAKPMNSGYRGADVRAVASNFFNAQPVLPRWLANGIHNIAVAALMFQLIIIYISAGMFKTQGALWQHGTALYYPLQLQEYKPLPFLSDLFTHFGILVGISTYVVVFIQLYFPVMLLHKVTRRIAISVVLLFHLSIAIMMALPWFSLSMVAFDAIFVSTSTYVALEGWLKERLGPVKDMFWDVADPVLNKIPGVAR